MSHLANYSHRARIHFSHEIRPHFGNTSVPLDRLLREKGGKNVRDSFKQQLQWAISGYVIQAKR